MFKFRCSFPSSKAAIHSSQILPIKEFMLLKVLALLARTLFPLWPFSLKESHQMLSDTSALAPRDRLCGTDVAKDLLFV